MGSLSEDCGVIFSGRADREHGTEELASQHLGTFL